MDEKTYFYEQVIYNELRSIHSKAHDKEVDSAYQDLIDAIGEVLNYSNIARKDGLLDLETYALALKNKADIISDFKSRILFMMIDGASPEVLRKSAIYSYISIGADPYKSLALLTFIEGMSMVQGGFNPLHIKNVLESMLPAEMRLKIRVSEKSEMDDSLKDRETKGYIDKIINRDFECVSSTSDLFSEMICELDNRNLQLLMLNTEDLELCSALRAASPEARKKVFANRSSRMSYNLAWNMENDKYVKFSDPGMDMVNIIRVAYDMAMHGDIILYHLNKYLPIVKG